MGIGKTTSLIVFILAVIGLIVMIVLLWRARRGTLKLERDNTGFWRYHKETQFQRKVAYGSHFKEDDGKSKNKEETLPLAVLHFSGDLRARQGKTFAKLVDEIAVNKDEIGEVVLVINSPGGIVPQYGHVFAQVERIRDLGIELTVCVDVVAASGGYLMSLPATKIIAAPFAMVGSVGVMAFVPNFRKLLTNLNINPRTFTAGKFKETVSLFDDASKEDIARFQNQLEAVHRLFLDALKKYRENVKFDLVETGEHWTAKESMELELGLVDEIGTSQDYLFRRNREYDLIFLTQKRNIWEDGMGRFVAKVFDQIENRVGESLFWTAGC